MSRLPNALIADIGGTNARFALVSEQGEILLPETLSCADYAGPVEAVRAYLGDKEGVIPTRAVFAIAGPADQEDIAATNMAWHFSVNATRTQLGLERFSVINDFTAVALSLPHLQEQDRRQIGGGSPTPLAPIGVLGAGTGLGVSGLVHGSGGWATLAGEGGHTTLCGTNEREDKIIALLREKFGHASAERILSGPGLVNLYNALSTLDGRPPALQTPDQITRAATDKSCPLCQEALQIFFSMLGTMAGNLALTLGAFGGIYIAGGIVPRLLDSFAASDFRPSFERKGRLGVYVKKIPTFVVTHPYPAFLGLSHLVRKS